MGVNDEIRISGGGENPVELFLKIGLDERTAKNTVANNKVTANLIAVIHEVVLFNFLHLLILSDLVCGASTVKDVFRLGSLEA